MSEHKHTSGPWAFEGEYTILGPWQKGSEVNRAGVGIIPKVATVAERSERIANARLIAAAPDLLAALEAMQKAYDQLIPNIKHGVCQDYQIVNEAPILASAAIAKAKGE